MGGPSVLNCLMAVPFDGVDIFFLLIIIDFADWMMLS